jgi:hypothetical protein
MLNRLLLTATLDGQAEALTKLHALVKERRPDGVLFAGRILGSNPVSHAAKLRRHRPLPGAQAQPHAGNRTGHTLNQRLE